VAYTYERPDFRALDELDQLLRHVGEELAAWRRRSLKAEAELQEYKTRGGTGPAGPELLQARQRVIDLEMENQQLRQRIEAARERVATIESRLTFLSQDREDGAA
jgi:chromosome segregation ATPase